MSELLSRILAPLLLLLVIICSTDVDAECIDVERQALLAFKHELNPKGENGNDLLPSWGMEGEAGDCCKWHGVGCSDKSGHVTTLDLSPETLRVAILDRSPPSVLGINPSGSLWSFEAGKINSALAELRYLEYVDLSYIHLNSSHFPSFFTTLTKLEYLNFSNCQMSGEIPPKIANLTRLEVLDLGYNNHIYAKSLNWVSSLSSLRKLDLSSADLSKVNSNWIETVSNLPYLTSLQLRDCKLPKIVTPTISVINSSTSLVTLDISSNFLAFPLHHWSLLSFSCFLIHLDISDSGLVGSIPKSIENMTALKYLDLHGNNLEGDLSISFENLCQLRFLDVSGNKLGGEFPNYTKSLARCRDYSLKHIDVSGNRMTGSVPDAIGQLRELEYLMLANNSLQGVISETHFSNLSKLLFLAISFNSITLNISSNWTPPFQLLVIGLGSCNLNSGFPKWLSTQNNYRILDMTNSGISGPIPKWFWGTISEKCLNIYLSENQISGTIEYPYLHSLSNLWIDMSSNKLEGPIPQFLFNVGVLNLSMNSFSNMNSLCGPTEDSNLMLLDISYNNLSGELPVCWSHLKNLASLNLGNNWFSGKIPVSICSLTQIKSLHLDNNNLSGELPLSLRNFSELSVFDVGENKLSGAIPPWLGKNMPGLLILSLQSNSFSGSIPPSLCDLEKLQLLDLSQNKLSWNIPKCVGNLTAMKMNTLEEPSISQSYHFGSTNSFVTLHFLDELRLVWKGRPSRYRNTLRLVKVIISCDSCG